MIDPEPAPFTPMTSPMEDWFLRFWKRLLKDQAEPTARYHLEHQHQIGPFYTDFAHVPTRTAIEIDGKSHHYASLEQVKRDLKRQAYLEAQGWTVIRFTGSQVRNCAIQCCQVVRNHITARLNWTGLDWTEFLLVFAPHTQAPFSRDREPSCNIMSSIL